MPDAGQRGQRPFTWRRVSDERNERTRRAEGFSRVRNVGLRALAVGHNEGARRGRLSRSDQQPRPTLPPKDVLDALARAAVDNADRLLTDASTLLAGGSAPSAHSLAVLALEEVGKAIICWGGFAGSDNTVTTREHFDRGKPPSCDASGIWTSGCIGASSARGMADDQRLGARWRRSFRPRLRRG
jgi:hypothetical protein